MRKILWISPNLPHYKIRFLDKLSHYENYEIIYLGIIQDMSQGYRSPKNSAGVSVKLQRGSKKYFALNINIWLKILSTLLNYKFNYVLIPVEIKFLPLIFYIYLLKKVFRYTLFAYNHSGLRTRRGKSLITLSTRRILFSLFDKVIFYTKGERELALQYKLIHPQKAFYANNTLDTELIQKNYNFKINESPQKNILFIGRLIPDKKIDLLFKYFYELKKYMANLTLSIVGDGPEAEKIKRVEKQNSDVRWYGAIIDEAKISEIMDSSHIVFIPGHTGLSIVHAFCYGKPFITLSSYKFQPPEIDYLEHGVNGLILPGNINDDIPYFIDLLQDKKKYKQFCMNAYEKAKKLSIQNWCRQMKNSLV